MCKNTAVIIFSLFLVSLIVGAGPSLGQAEDLDMDGLWDGTEEKAVEPWLGDQISEISIGMIQTGGYSSPYNRLTGLGFDVTLISADSGLSTFENYDIVYLPVQWAELSTGDYATIESHASEYRSFVSDGGGLFIDQPNPYQMPNSRVTPTLLPYPITFFNDYNLSDWPPTIVNNRHDITQGLSASEMPGPADQMESVDSRYHILVKGSVTNAPSLVIAGYGRGKILVQTAHPSTGAINPFSDEVYIRMVEWVGPIMQTVYLDFTDFTTTQYGVDRTTAINSITAAMQRDYGDFNFIFETTQPDGVYSTVDLGGDSTPGLFGIADQLDLRNAQKFDDCLSYTDEWDDQEPTLYDNLTALTNTVGATSSHELGHIQGHTHYSPVPLGAGLQPGNDEPNWPDITTNFHIMATFHSGCNHTKRAARNRYFGRREWRDLEMNDRSYGTNVIEEQTASHGSMATAQGISTFAGRRVVIGEISSGGELDYYSQYFGAGEIIDIRTYSYLINQHVGLLGDLVGRISNTIDPILELRNSGGTLVADNDDFYGSGTDATILEYAVPSSGTYYIVVKAFSSGDTGGYELYIDRTNFLITEVEPNDNVAAAQVISAPGNHRGYCETAEEGPLTIGFGGDDIEDVYEFTLTSMMEVTVQLDPTVYHYTYDWTEPSVADLDLVLFESDLSILGVGFNGTNGATETITSVLGPGTYYIGVTAYDPEEVYSEYRLDVSLAPPGSGELGVDFDGDATTDIAVYRSGTWFILPSSGGSYYAVGFGGDPNDVPVPGDYDGDGKTDIAVYRTGTWFILPSSGGSYYAVGFGGDPNDVPVPGDYDGDAKTDIAVYRTGTWFILPSSGGSYYAVGFGGDPNDVPVPGDYDGDGKTDMAVYRTGTWFILPSSGGSYYAVGFGGDPNDVPVPGDYDGDGKTDMAVYRTGTWFILPSSGGSYYAVGFGGDPNDVTVPGDYDGDTKTDIAVYRTGTWFILPSSGGSYYAVGFGGDPNDIPVNPTAVMFLFYM